MENEEINNEVVYNSETNEEVIEETTEEVIKEKGGNSIVKIIAIILIVVVVGYVIFKIVTPSSESLQDINPNPNTNEVVVNNQDLLYTKALQALSEGNRTEAKESLIQLLDDNPDHVEGIFLLAQVSAEDGDLDSALALTKDVVALVQDSTEAFFQLGVLEYQLENYTGALTALTSAVELAEDFSNARYFKGLSHDKLGESNLALVEFKKVKELNPENEELSIIISNLESGKSALDSL